MHLISFKVLSQNGLYTSSGNKKTIVESFSHTITGIRYSQQNRKCHRERQTVCVLTRHSHSHPIQTMTDQVRYRPERK